MILSILNNKAFHFGRKRNKNHLWSLKTTSSFTKTKLISGIFTPLGNRNSLDKFAFKQVATAELIHKNYTRLQYYYLGLPMKPLPIPFPSLFLCSFPTIIVIPNTFISTQVKNIFALFNSTY